LHGRADAAGQALDPARLEVGAPRLGGLHGEAGIFEPKQDQLPLRLDAGRILLDEMKVGTRRKRFREPHAGAYPCLLGCPRARADEGTLSRRRRERNR
jgi:hypothetical protein